MAYTFNQKNWIAGEVITANGVNRIEECLGHLVDEKQNILYFDAVPTADSQNLVNSGGIYNALKALDNFTIDRRPSPDSQNAVQSRGIYEALLGKQDLLIFDSTPKSSSGNPVTSQGIYQALNLKQNNLTFDNTPINNSNNPVTSNGVYQALLLKQNNLTFDSIPILNSNHPVTSNGVYQSLLLKQDNLTFDISPSLNSNNPVTSEGIYISLQNLSNELNASLEEIELKIPNAQVQSDWNITDSTSKAYIKNKPLIPTKTSQLINDSGFLTVHQDISGKADKSTTVSNVAYDTTNKRITKTINGTTSNVVSAVTLKTDMSLSNVENKSSATIRSEITRKNVIDALGFTPLNFSLKGANNGVAELDDNGRIPSSQLPSYIDDVLEYSSKTIFPSVGETDKIYVATDTNLTYRWSGSSYVAISSSITLGTTSSTAFRGDYGNTAYTHAVNKGSAFNSGLYKITTNSEGHVITAIAVVKSDITALGIPENNIQADWEDNDAESEAYIKNKPKWPTIILNEKYLFKNSYSNTARVKNDMRLWEFHPSETIVKQLIVGRKYIIQINDNIYEEYFQHAEHANFPLGRYYFVGSFFPQINVEEMWGKGFGIDFDKVDENSFQIREINFKEREIQKFSITELLIGRQYLDMPDWSKELTKPTYTASEVGAIPITEKGISGGVATLDENGIVTSSQLPAYVDTILEYDSLSNFPSIGESGKIYVALDTNKSYRWSGTQYIEISSSVSLGEVQGTAYEGHKGKANALAINDLQNNKANKSTTISGYGIIDAKIENGIITLGNNTIQPIIDNNYNHTDNNFTNEEKNKLAQINTEAEKNVQSDWNITDINSDAYIKNKPNIINTIAENNNNLVTSGAIYTELIKKQNNLINVPEISEIKPTDYIYIERNQTIYKILASKIGKFTPDESNPNAIETNDGNIITDENGNEIIIDNNSDSDPNAVETNNGDIILDENGNEIIIDTNTTDTVETNDGKIILTEDQRELNLG